MIDLIDITKQYREDKVIIKDRSFSVQDNEFISVVGPSGIGKSTLLNIVGLLDSDYSGKYFLNERCMDNLSDRKKSKIRNEQFGFIFQSYNLLEDLNVYENIILPIVYSNKKMSLEFKEHLEHLSDLLSIKDIMKMETRFLSGGEKQRVAIARALLFSPEYILADEPTGNLDSCNESIVLELFKQLKSEGKTIILVTHSQRAAQFADRVIDLGKD
nr:ABC transporter ATP-binding protein [uncultured Lachnoclostridium sp.]